MIEGKVVAVDHVEAGRTVRLQVEVDYKDVGSASLLGERVILVGDRGFTSKSALCERGSQYLLVPSRLRTAGVRRVAAKKADLSTPERTLYVFRCER